MIEGLRGMRLGCHERNLLLHSPEPDAPLGAILDPSLQSHSDRETYLRAVRKLARASLLSIDHLWQQRETQGVRTDGRAISRRYRHQAVRMTSFGMAVRRVLHEPLASGSVIRWNQVVPLLLAELRLPTSLLAKRFSYCVQGRVKDLSLAAKRGGAAGAEARKLVYLLQPIVSAI